MLKRKRFIATFVGLLALGMLSAVLLVRYKYYVKKFIKSHDLLYASAQKVAHLKHDATKMFRHDKTSVAEFPNTNFDVTNWSLNFDASKSLGKYERFWGNLGLESFKNGILNSQGRQLFEMMKETNARTKGVFRYIRGHNLFSDGKPPWGEGCVKVSLNAAGEVVCDWDLADRVFDKILGDGFRPIVEFGFMPDVLASLPERRQKWGHANFSPPKDYDLWQNLIHQTVRHFCERYGEEEISKWYFEVWNEPDLGYLFWVEDPQNKPWGDFKQYLKLYDHAVYGAKTACPKIRVGGPASAGGYLEELLEHVILEDSFAGYMSEPRIDFVSSHSYGFVTEQNRKGMNVYKAIRWKLGRVTEHDHPKVRQYMKNLPFLLTETGFRSRNSESNNDRFTAAWLAKFVTMNFYLGDKLGMSYQPTEFVFWSDLQVSKDFAPTRGLAASIKTKAGRRVFKRPVYNAFEALGFLSDERIALTTGARFGDPVFALATKDEDNSIEILVYHLNERDEGNGRKDTLDITLSVQNLPFRKYEVNHYLVDENHSNVYSAWRKMGRPKNLTDEQAARLSTIDDLELARMPWQEESTDYTFRHGLRLQSNSVAVFVLTNIESGNNRH